MRVQAFGPYDLIERVGVGSMGEVFRAVLRTSGTQVALKRLMPFVAADADVVEALHGEANLARALDHPSIAKVFEVSEVRGTHYIAYEYVHGRDLRALTERAQKRGERVALDVSIDLVSQVALALAHAHGRRDAAGRLLGLVHRDVSPSNILVAFDGSVKLSDFGIALAEGRVGRTAAGQVKGTIGYMSPEQVAGGEVDGRSDLYALGVCLWELVTGARIFEGVPALVVMERMAKGDVPAPRSLVPDLPADLDALVVKSLAPNPAQRYPGAEEFNEDLTRVAQRLGQLADSTRVAQYVRSLFPEAADSAAQVPDGARGAGPWQECLTMADSKGGSDLDVFEGLSKKSTRSAPPGLTPPPPSAGPRQRTLVGGLAGALPPPPTSTPLPPPSMPRPPASNAAPLPAPGAPPMSGRLSGPLPMPPPPSGRVSGLPQVSPPPRSSATPSGIPGVPGRGSLPPPTITPMRPPAALPPPSMPRPSTATPLPPPPGTLRPNDQAVPPPADKSLASALGVDGAKKAGGKSSVDMDWDDEEESTHVYDKQQHGDVSPKGVRPAAGTPAAPRVSAAAALLASSGGAARSGAPMSQPPNTMPTGVPHSGPMPMSHPQMAHPPLPMPNAPPYVPAHPSSRDEPTSLRVRPQPSSGSSKAGLVLGLIALFAVIGMAVFMFFPRSGQFKIDIKSKGGAPVAKAEIFIDGQKKCDTAPCVVSDLSPGPKVIKVIAPDSVPADMTETVEAGKEKLVLITIDGAASASTGGTGFKAVGNQPGVKVLVDGADKGVLPVELKDLTPGAHKVRFEGDRYSPKEETIDVVANQMKELAPVQLKVLKGTLTIELATAGASVTLTGQGGKKEKKTLDSVLKVGTPVKLSDIDATQTWKLHATKKGLADFDQEVTFEDGQPEKSIRIELGEPGKPAPVAAAGPRPAAPGAGPAAGAPKEPAEPKTPDAPAAAGGSGTLNINSIPVSKVVLDGRPLGSTPKVGVSVPAGNHTVTFIHPELGKKSVTVAVKAGETKTAAVKFK